MYSDDQVAENLLKQDNKVFVSTELLRELAVDLTAEAFVMTLQGDVEEGLRVARKADTLTDVADVMEVLHQSLTSK